MFAQTQATPPPIERLATTPVLASEMPPGYTRVKIVLLPPNKRFAALGGVRGVRIDFSNADSTISESYALMKTKTAAVRFAQTEAKTNGGSLFRVRSVAAGRFAVAVTGRTASEASNVLRLAVAHLHRVNG